MHTAGLSSNVDELHQCIHAMGEEVRILKEQLRLALRRQFGSQSEAFSPEQLSLLALSDVEVIVTETKEAPDSKPSTTPRVTRQAVLVSKDTPVERVELDVADKTCDCCGGTLHRIGEDCSYQVAFIPAQTKVVETARPKYGCRDCETGVKQQPLPPALIPKSMATASLLAYLIVSKYVDHLPLNRLQGILKRYGITLPRSTQCEWLMRCARLLKPLTQRMREDLLQSPQVFTDDTILPLQRRQEAALNRSGVDVPRNTLANWMIKSGELIQPLINLLEDKLLTYPVMHCDETTLQVLKEPDKEASQKSYMWVRAGGPPTQPVRLFHYADSRRGEPP